MKKKVNFNNLKVGQSIYMVLISSRYLDTQFLPCRIFLSDNKHIELLSKSPKGLTTSRRECLSFCKNLKIEFDYKETIELSRVNSLASLNSASL